MDEDVNESSKDTQIDLTSFNDIHIQHNRITMSGTSNLEYMNDIKTKFVSFKTFIGILYKRQDVRLGSSFFIYSLTLLILLSLENRITTATFPILGGLFGLCGSLFVIIYYLLYSTSLENSSITLLFWRAVCDIGVAVRFISVHYSSSGSSPNDCTLQSFFLEFFEMSAEFWFFCVALDLLSTTTNPFSSFKSRLILYHMIVWSAAILSAIVLVSVKGAAGVWEITKTGDESICWLHMKRTNMINWVPWIFFYLPIIVIYSFSAIVVAFSFFRLRNGVPKTLLNRTRLLVMNTINVTISIIYWIILGSLYIATFFMNENNDEEGNMLFKVILYLMSSKGFWSFIVWQLFAGLDFNNSKDSNKLQNLDRLDLNNALRQEVMYYATKGIRISARMSERLSNSSLLSTKKKISFYLTESFSKETMKSIFNFWFVIRLMLGFNKELSTMNSIAMKKTSHFNVSVTSVNEDIEHGSGSSSKHSSLRKVHYNDTINNSSLTDDKSNHIDAVSIAPQSESTLNPLGVDKISTQQWGSSDTRKSEFTQEADIGDEEIIALADLTTKQKLYYAVIKPLTRFLSCFSQLRLYETVDFTALEPYQFARIRAAGNVSHDKYTYAFEHVLKERLTSGGASGAFFFFSESEEFIGKSCTLSEMETLTKNAAKYADYLCDPKNTSTLISKIYGAYKLRMYGVSLYFFITNNLFLNDEKLLMNEKYDIKGSWVSRNATPAIHGQQATCTHCGQKFRFLKVKRHNNRVDRLTSNGTASGDNHSAFRRFKGGSVFSMDNQMLNPFGSSTTNLNSSPTTTGTGTTAASIVGQSNDLKGFLKKFQSASISGVSTTNNELSIDITNDSDHGALENKCFYTVDGRHEPHVIMKDNDLKFKIMLPASIASDVRLQLKYDAQFLCSIGIMDYSLIVGVHKNQFDLIEKLDERERDANASGSTRAAAAVVGKAQYNDIDTRNTYGGDDDDDDDTASNSRQSEGYVLFNKKKVIVSTDKDCDVDLLYTTKKLYANKVVGPHVYLMGIIDFQQQWTFDKKLERFIKTVVKGEDGDGLSAIEPTKYMQRFISKIEDIL